jgi:sulfopyruvate decarboxylase subunit beta
MKRIDALRTAAENAGDRLIVCNLGDPARELYAAKDRDENFYMLGSMGLASSIGLGLALALEDRGVIALDGDGAVMMNLGTLATLAAWHPDNFLLIIVDNCCYGSTGGQPSPTSCGADLVAIARAAGNGVVGYVTTLEDLAERVRSMHSGVIVARVEPGGADSPLIDLPAKEIMHRFMRAARPSP